MIAREQAYCFKCGKPLKAIHRNMGRNFVGGTFLMWDYEGHKCDETTAQYKKWKAEQKKLEEYRNSPAGKKKAAEFRKMLKSKPQARIDKLIAPEKNDVEKSDVEKFDEYLHKIADTPVTNVRRKFLAIKKFAEGLADKTAKNDD